jgi:hypothetical protein
MRVERAGAEARAPEGLTHANDRVDATRPVFIAGPDRSGTTLMLALLASHPQLSMVRRTNMWRYFHGRYGDLSNPTNLDRCLDDMIGFRRMRHLEPDRERIRREFLEGDPTYGRLFALFHVHNAERAGTRRWGDKSLHTEHYADRVFAEFPEARIVHMMRDPRDRYASVRKRWGRDESRVAGATGRWLQSTRAARRSAGAYPDGYLIVRYEDLAAHPEDVLRRVCTFVDLPYAPEMLSMSGVPEVRDRGGNSSYGAREAGTISTRSVGRYREVLPADEITFIERAARSEMAAFGYDPAVPDMSTRDRLRFSWWYMPRTALRMRAGMALESRNRRRGDRVPATKRADADANDPENAS